MLLNSCHCSGLKTQHGLRQPQTCNRHNTSCCQDKQPPSFRDTSSNPLLDNMALFPCFCQATVPNYRDFAGWVGRTKRSPVCAYQIHRLQSLNKDPYNDLQSSPHVVRQSSCDRSNVSDHFPRSFSPPSSCSTKVSCCSANIVPTH